MGAFGWTNNCPAPRASRAVRPRGAAPLRKLALGAGSATLDTPERVAVQGSIGTTDLVVEVPSALLANAKLESGVGDVSVADLRPVPRSGDRAFILRTEAGSATVTDTSAAGGFYFGGAIAGDIYGSCAAQLPKPIPEELDRRFRLTE